MMSQDHQQPGDGEEAGEDEEEGDIEARTAVAALLALTSPTDYAYTGYDEDSYLMEEAPDDYMNKSLSAKCVPDYDEDGEQLVTQDGELGVRTVQGSEAALIGESDLVAYPSSECHEADDGLAQLRAFVQVTEGKSDDEGTPKLSSSEEENQSHHKKGLNFPSNSVQDVREGRAAKPVQGKSNNANIVPDLAACAGGKSSQKGSSVVPSHMQKTVLSSASEKKGLVCLKSEAVGRGKCLETDVVYRKEGFAALTNRGSQEMPVRECLIPDQNLASERSHKDLTEGKGSSTLDDSDSDSDSDSDGDSDSDSSDSSSSGSDDASDSESDSESDSPDVEKSEKIGSVATAQPQNVSPSIPLKVVSQNKDVVTGDKDENKGRDFNTSKQGSEKKPAQIESKSPPVLKVHSITSGNDRHLATSKDDKKTVSEKKGGVPAVARDESSKFPGKADREKNEGKKVEDVSDPICKRISPVRSNDKTEIVVNSSAKKGMILAKEKSKVILSAKTGRTVVSQKEKEELNINKKESDGMKGLVESATSSKPTNQSEEKTIDARCNNKENKSIQKTSNAKGDLSRNAEMKPKVVRKNKSALKAPDMTRGVDSTERISAASSQQLSSPAKQPASETPKVVSLKALHCQKEKESSVKSNSSEKLNSRNNSSDSQIKNGAADKGSRKEVNNEKADSNCDKDVEDKFEGEIDDMFPMPIQAEVVMSDGSESGIEYGEYDKPCQENDSVQWFRRSGELLQQSDKENSELVAYLQSFVNGGGEGEVVEYPPPNNELPAEGTDLTQWQLDGVHLPPFTPNVAPPSWLRLTIPAEGYRCHSCGDTFFIESSLVQHRERRSVWINLECGPCDAKLTFYNRCALKDHLRTHLLHGEEVDEETVDVRALPLQLTRLLQPILVPVPHSLLVGNILCTSAKSHGSITKLPTLKPVGKGTTKHSNEKLSVNGSLEENYDDEDYSFDEDMLSSPEKIPVGMKRLSPRRRTVRCYLCERMFHSVRELMAHMRTDQPYSDQRVECRKCQLVLPSVCAAKAHILTHPPANTSNVSVCPECGSRCDGPRDFVHHLNTCGHQFRRSGVVCTVCQVCFFKSQDDFLTHWILEHCEKSYECVVCQNTFESLVFHNCQSPGQQVLATFRCLLTCPLCSQSVQLHAQEESDANVKIQSHLADCHPSIITRVHYVYKSKFCTNAFRSKDELRAHHDREHRRDNHYRTKTCTLHHEVLGYQHQYFNGQEPRNAFVTLPVALSAEELHEARIRDVPTVSSVIDKTLFPDVPSLDSGKIGKIEKLNKVGKVSNKEIEFKGLSLKDSPIKKDIDQLDKLRPNVCYRCGYMYLNNKDFRRHKRTCDGEANERQCQVCGLTATGEEFARHCRGHIQENVILCIYCNGTQFSNSVDLEQHFELHVHEQFLYPAICAFCCTSLPDVPSALAHLNEEHDPFHVQFDTSEFECNRCGRRFHGERGLSVHLGRCTLGTATPTPSSTGCRQCQVCTKALTAEMFGRHMVSHLEEGLLVCSLCDGRTLPSSMALLHHLEEHATALAYPSLCPMCNYAMLNATSALTHLKEEHGFGNLLCAECDMHYNFTYQLQRHTDIVHKICLYAKRRYICWICRAYDHVKKETLMNHFRTVHGLDREQVDEKVMIRTRGQGTMPTSQFIPTKPLGSKEIPGLSSPSKAEGDSSCSTKPQKEKSKTSPGKSLALSESPDQRQNSKAKSQQGSPGKILSGVTSGPIADKMNTKRKEDIKLKDKTKVLIKRLPDSILDDQSRCKRRKVLGLDDKVLLIKKPKKKRKKIKAYKCSTCGFGTNNKEKHDNHILKHKEALEEIEPDGYVCSECGASFVVEPSLARHMFFAHRVKLPVTNVDESESDVNNPDRDASVSSASNNSCKDALVTVKTSSTSKDDPLICKGSGKDKSNEFCGKDELGDPFSDKDEVVEGSVKHIGETKKKKEVKNEVKQVNVNKTGSEAKRRKVTPVVEEGEAKTRKVTPVIEEGEAKRRKVAPVVEEGEAKRRKVAPVIEEGEAKRRKVTPVVEESEGKRKKVAPVVEEGEGKRRKVVPVVEEGEGKRRKVAPVVEEGEAKRRKVVPVVEEGEGKRRKVAPVVEEGEGKRRKVALVVGEMKIEEEKEMPIIKKEVEVENKPVKEGKKAGKVNALEVKDTIAKRKVARITAQKKLRKEVMKVKKEVTKVKLEKDNTKKKVIKEVIKKRLVDVSVKKSVAKGTTKTKLMKDSTKRRSKEVKKKTLKVVTKKRLDKDLEMARSGEEMGEIVFDDRCVVCKEKFPNPVELYSHLRTHGMAFLKLGRKARPLGVEKPIDR